MHQYKAIVKVGGVVMSTIVFAENPNYAYKLVQQQYGANNVVSPPMQLTR
ncbi:hypothetical protein [Polynucleobacter sp. MWH-UH35A]|nr:hypothetical protein [Polynucleobacter sp. MWH-UH35A]QWD59911.1 hypothetical protein ICV36_08975 [Polynucleobacter sp. MWH-UH35A]